MKKTILSTRKYKAGYEVRKELVDDREYGGDGNREMRSAYNLAGDYIGNSKTAHYLCVKRGIVPEKMSETSNVCCIGFCEREQKWYGWSHRAICGFGIGDVVKEGDCTTSSGWTAEYLAEHLEADVSLPVGFEAQTLDDARRMAIAFAESVG